MANSPADTPDIDTDSAPATGAKVKLLSLADLDKRTTASKSARALISEMHADLGGEDRLSAAERTLVTRAAIITAMLEHHEAAWLSGKPIDVGIYTTLVNSARRLFADLGLERRPRDVVPELHAYIEARAIVPPPPP